MTNNTVPAIMFSLFEICENIHITRHFPVLSNENSRTENHDCEIICSKHLFFGHM